MTLVGTLTLDRGNRRRLVTENTNDGRGVMVGVRMELLRYKNVLGPDVT